MRGDSGRHQSGNDCRSTFQKKSEPGRAPGQEFAGSRKSSRPVHVQNLRVHRILVEMLGKDGRSGAALGEGGEPALVP